MDSCGYGRGDTQLSFPQMFKIWYLYYFNNSILERKKKKKNVFDCVPI